MNAEDSERHSHNSKADYSTAASGALRQRYSFASDLFLAAATNLVASLLMKFVLEGATMAGGSDADRLLYIASHRGAVVFAWGTWVAATLGLLLSFWVWNLLLDKRLAYRLRFGFAIATVGAALDIAADVLQMSVIPVLAAGYAVALSQAGDATGTSGVTPGASGVALDTGWDGAGLVSAAVILHSFQVWDTAAVALTGGAGNTLYAVAGLIITSVMFRTSWIPRWLCWWGVAVWVVAGLASAALFWFPRLLPAGVASEMVLYIGWTTAAGVYLLRQGRRAGQVDPVEPI